MKNAIVFFFGALAILLCELAMNRLIVNAQEHHEGIHIASDAGKLPAEGTPCSGTDAFIYPVQNGSEWSWRVRYCAHVHDKSFDWVDRGFSIGSDVVLSPWSLPNEMPLRWTNK
jgi:hypothetical protein